MPKASHRLAGFLFIELLVVCALIGILLPLLIQITQTQLHQQTQVRYYLQAEQIKAALNDQLTAQWGRIKPAACYYSTGLVLQIGRDGHDLPARLADRQLMANSDWLAASDFGFCRLSLDALQTAQMTLPNACAWKSKQAVWFRTCSASFAARITSVSSQKVKLQVSEPEAIDQAGIFEGDSPYYWYLAQGKEAIPALWRRPQVQGNALEIWSGLEKVAIYPLLDKTGNGEVDGIATHYGHFALSQVKALWVEYLYRLTACENTTHALYSYTNLRGDLWEYQPPCTRLGQHLVNLTGGPNDQ